LSPNDILCPWKENYLWIHRCGLTDHQALQDWADAALKDDYYFKRGHFQALLAKVTVQVYAAAVGTAPDSPTWATSAFAIVYQGTRLLNLYIAKEFRSMGLGSFIMRYLSPSEIRAKTDMTAGDPRAFYERLGYTVQSTGEGPNGTIAIMRNDTASTIPWMKNDAKQPF
jgi:GNAT superfamily N-acetyltransferase